MKHLIRRLLNPNTERHWDAVYDAELDAGRVRCDSGLLEYRWLFDGRERILDFGSGPGGNVEMLSQQLSERHFTLIDHSDVALEHARRTLRLGANGNTFEFERSLDAVPRKSQDLVMSFEVLEHLTEFDQVLDELWGRVRPGGVLLVSVPVKGRRDRHREHVNKFTVGSMFRILSRYSNWVHIAPRSFSQRSGILSTAYFYIERSR